MKKTIPFHKEITFNNPVSAINSIALEHTITTKKEGIIAGNFIINGDYKLASSSEHLDAFEYNLPFSITVDNKYNIDNSIIDISDFYYEVMNSKILKVDIELAINNIEEVEIEKPKEETPQIEEKPKEEKPKEEKPKEEKPKEETLKEEKTQTDEKSLDREDNEKITNESIFNNIEGEEKYVTYKVHIVTENDTIESIIMNYGVTKENLIDYNDLSNFQVGNKIIIPANES